MNYTIENYDFTELVNQIEVSNENAEAEMTFADMVNTVAKVEKYH